MPIFIVRQAGILQREVLRFRSRLGLDEWPCIIGGGLSSLILSHSITNFTPSDFNCAPDDPTYSLMVGDPLLVSQEALLDESRVIHKSIDPKVPMVNTQITEDEAGDPDRTIVNARLATSSDGLLSSSELSALFQNPIPLRSAYDEGLAEHRESPTYGDRVPIPELRRGGHEPEYTAYTHYWKTVLGMPLTIDPNIQSWLNTGPDYIFIQDSPSRRYVVTGLLSPHRTADLEPGLPQKNVCGSDHISLCVELAQIPKP